MLIDITLYLDIGRINKFLFPSQHFDASLRKYVYALRSYGHTSQFAISCHLVDYEVFQHLEWNLVDAVILQSADNKLCTQ